jgi:hypothetical protein
MEVVTMKALKALRGVGAAACLAVSLLAAMASGALAASSIYLCIGEKAGQGVKSGGTTAPGTCPKLTEKQKVVYIPVALPKEAAEQERLLSILPHIKYEASGVGGKPTIQFSGVNVQVVNGEGKTASANGEGNLVIGYDENKEGKHEQTGSHDLVLGEEQTFTSFGGILAGRGSTISGPFASVTGGLNNIASGEDSWASGGQRNVASGFDSSISGGQLNEAGFIGSVSGGAQNRASRGSSWVGGGKENNAAAEFASIFGGKGLKAEKEFEAIP